MQRGSGFPQRRRHLWPEAKSEVDFEKEATFDAHFRAPYEPPCGRSSTFYSALENPRPCCPS